MILINIEKSHIILPIIQNRHLLPFILIWLVLIKLVSGATFGPLPKATETIILGGFC
jgi:hypothetical protein